MLGCNKFRYKNRWLSEAAFRKRLQTSKLGKERKKPSSKLNYTEEPVHHSQENTSVSFVPVDETTDTNETVENVDENVDNDGQLQGRRIVEFSVLAEELWCVHCREVLSLKYLEEERRQGLASILQVRCHKCLVINTIHTGKKHVSSNGGTTRFDVNSKMVLGIMHAGMGWTQLNKILSCLNIPTICFKTYKRYEKEIGPLVETVAKESCATTVTLERNFTIKNAAEIEKLMPQNLQENFIIPNKLATTPCQEAEKLNDEPTNIITFDDVVRVMASYDMGWSKRGSGRNYDSLNGYGAIIGAQSGRVLDYSTCNRKCKRCDMGQDQSKHDCRKNFWGSAKAMEPHVAESLVNNSEILRSQNVEVGVLIGDDDSSSIAACRATSSHPIVKFSDTNHASGGVTKSLYKIMNNHKELTKDGILYLRRCFTYAMTTNKGNSATMARDIRCIHRYTVYGIPYHAFNDHTQCGTWCGFVKGVANYDHTMIPGGFHDPELFEALKDIFHRLAANAEKFSAGASSNVNESLNASMVSKAPKSRCYSLTASADYRFAGTVAQKNEGEHYIAHVLKAGAMSPGRYRSRYVETVEKTAIKRRHQIRTAKYKKRRLALKKMRTALRHRRENEEGTTYQSNCTLLDNNIDPMTSDAEIDDDQCIVLLDLETSGFSRDCDILQIAAKCGKLTFATYITPTKTISPSATEANGLTNCGGVLMHNGLIVDSIPLKLAMSNLLQWLASLGKPCYIATHNLSFDGPRLFNAIVCCSLRDDFRDVVCGFIDTLTVVKKVTGRKGKGKCTITGLAEWQKISTAGVHNAEKDVSILNKILRSIKISGDILVTHANFWEEQTNVWVKQECAIQFLNDLAPLKNVVGETIRKKMAYASINIVSLRNAFRDTGMDGIVELLSRKVDGKPNVTNHKPSLEKIRKWAEETLFDKG